MLTQPVRDVETCGRNIKEFSLPRRIRAVYIEILEYDISDKCVKENRFIFYHILTEILQVCIVHKLPYQAHVGLTF